VCGSFSDRLAGASRLPNAERQASPAAGTQSVEAGRVHAKVRPYGLFNCFSLAFQ
jgi:hypothetical protein